MTDWAIAVRRLWETVTQQLRREPISLLHGDNSCTRRGLVAE
jgi:hypothetical protein